METSNAPEIPGAEVIQEQVDRASGFINSVKEYLLKAMPSIVIAIIVLILGMLISKLISKMIARALTKSSVDKAARSFLSSFIRIILYTVVLVMALSVLNVPMSSIITILGAAGLAVSLALQNCLSNLCGGFIILFSKPFAAGDMVEVDGAVGTVSTIGILYTKLRTSDGRTILIPNGKLTDAKLTNYTETPNRRVELTFDIGYNADYSMARQLILTAVSENKLILSDPAPIVRMSAHRSSSVAIDVLVWTANENYNEVRYSMNENVKQLFDKYGVEIPYEQLDVHVIRPEE